MKHVLLTTILLSAFMHLTPAQLIAQYTVAPNAFVITDPARSSEMIVRLSPDARAMEFEVSSFFAIPQTDSAGNFVLLEPGSHLVQDISSKLRFSPRRFVLNSGEQQIVRIMVTDDNLGQGEYWSRIVVSAKSVSAGSMGGTQELSVSMGLEIRTISGLLYRKGKLQSDIELISAKPSIRNDSLLVDVEISKESPAAWIGTASFELLDAELQPIWKIDGPANFYLGGRYRLSHKMNAPPLGTHQLRITLTTTRDDPTLPLIRARDVVTVIPLQINP